MAESSSLLKSPLHNSIAEGLYREIQSRQSSYYYFLGRTLEWEDETTPPTPRDTFKYENDVRNEIITLKQIKATDIAFVIPRVDWRSGTIYDQFDDRYGGEVVGIDVISGGFGYADVPTITITGGSGTGATAEVSIADGSIVGVTMTSNGYGYTSVPTITITGGGGGEGANLEAVIVRGQSGAQQIEQANMFVMTDEYNVYKCLDNNQNSLSTFKPIGTVVDPVIMPDGYMWKYLYSIPISLRNKFLTDSYMPVINSLRKQFYSNGEILNVNLLNKGQNYTFSSITVQGDGFVESDPLLLNNVVITNPGVTPYNQGATVTIAPPFTDASTWADQNFVLLGQKVFYGNNIYECIISGTLAAPAPTHTAGVVSNGSAALKYIGTTATGTVDLNVSNFVTGITLIGSIYRVSMTQGGSGYTSSPVITITGGGGSGAILRAVMNGNSVAYIRVVDQGSGFTSAPTLTFGTEWTSQGTVNAGDQIFYSNRLYTVTIGGTLDTNFPTHNTGSDTNGTATLEYVGVPATGTAILKYGSGYSTLPSVTIEPVSQGTGAAGYFNSIKSEARLVPIVNDQNEIDNVVIEETGVGYTYANLTVGGDGNSAEIEADLDIGDISTLQANTELLTVAGQIMSIIVVSGGYGYGVAPTVTITGDGTGATAIAHVEGGRIKKIEMTNYGSGYRYANVSITTNGEGLGYAATARAVITPFGGHGKDPVNGTYARSLMFYTDISKDANQGFTVDNDFRQLGIIKNPRKFQSVSSLTETLASGCYVCSGTISTQNFQKDQTVRLGSITGPRFRIVSLTTSSVLLQSLDNAVPTIGTIMINENSNSFAINGVTSPTVDKYSGDLLFIDNKQAFTPTEDETVILRTVIKF